MLNLIVVAHPDDEILWASSIIKNAKKVIICFGKTSSLTISKGRIGFSLKFKHPVWTSIFHLFSEIIFLCISLSSFIKYNFLGGIKWKSRKYGK